MVTMRHRFMSAVWTVRMRAVNLRRALHGICRIDRDDMLVHVILVHMVEMAVMKIIQMAVMANRSVPATRAVLMSVIGVVPLVTCGHWRYSLRSGIAPDTKNPRYPLVPPRGSCARSPRRPSNVWLRLAFCLAEPFDLHSEVRR
jgi:hypothetical protein